MIIAQDPVGDLTDLPNLAPMFFLTPDASRAPTFAVREQFDVTASVTVDDRGYARVVIHDPLGRLPGDRIPLWSVAEDRLIGDLTVGTGVIKNGHATV